MTCSVRSNTKKNQKSNNSLTSIEITVSQPDGIVQIDSTSCTNQQEQLPLSSSTPRLLSPSSSTQQEQISSSSLESPQLLSPSSKRRQERISLPLPTFPELL
ncbi:unnamed protein product [Rotaria magnacalcarata]|uniref:Uncharacterized protein n=1 Tax=Rotaria magnacalcarata TaxID=392030 RepID=A0A820CB82_9BILA|nr:unnamed protein product [Rotaria magnacalcarata]CAF4211070.1 unnamed protein product [Rotaria magnacalcarata]